jgi:hypothetical protein
VWGNLLLTVIPDGWKFTCYLSIKNNNDIKNKKKYAYSALPKAPNTIKRIYHMTR